MSGDDAQRAMDPGDPGPKGFQVFLSHSGRQKAFVAQLDKDLRARDVHPFFDEDVEKRCLPIGEKVQDRIFKAIEDCRVGVVILSEDFFTCTVWPMLELEKMVECKKKIMPVFLGISPEQLFSESKLEEWISAWKGLEQPGMEVNIPNWVRAVEHLREVKGFQLVYRKPTGVVKFREEIVKEIRKVAPPRFLWDDSHVQGGTRMSKVIQAKLRGRPATREGVQVVGLYGIGGIGKTTACKSLCKDLFTEFDGRVCHIEFGADSNRRGEMERVQKVLKRLTNVDNESLKDKDMEECWSLLRDHLASQEPLSSNKVVLAIDNVSMYTRDEVQRYRRLKFDRGSVVMVIARELDELERNNIDSSNCLAMPELVKEEARALFEYYAEPKNGVDEGVIMEYVNRCYFKKGDGEGSKHYHPLALQVLGSQMVGMSPLEWNSHLKQEDVLSQPQEQDHPVFKVLRRSFDSLKNELKMLFMDVTLFDDGGALRNFISGQGSIFAIDYEQRSNWYTIFEWLSIVHGTSVDKLKERLNVLKKRALLEELGDGTGKIGMHDLWREFAFMESKRGEEEESQWVYDEYGLVVYNKWRGRNWMSGGGRKKLRRIFILGGGLGSENLRKCSEVRVLRLSYVYVENGALDLSDLKSLKSLEMVGDSKGQRFHKVSGIGQLLNLGVLIWLNISYESMSGVEEVSCLTNLQVLHLSNDRSFYSTRSMSLDLERLRYLRDVRVSIRGMVSVSGFSSRMEGLRILDFAGCGQLRRCAGVGDVNGLEVLRFHDCSKLEELPNLQKLVRLRILDIHNCKLLKALPGLRSLDALQVLCGGHTRLTMKELSSICNLAKLEVLDLRRCYELKCIPGLRNLVALLELGIYCGCLHGLPDLRTLTKLQKVEICGSNSDDCKAGCGVSGNVLDLAILEFVPTLKIDGVDHELNNLSKLIALKSLELEKCNFERLPLMGSDMILESLTIRYCERLRGWDGLRGLETGPDSQVDTSSDWTLPFMKEIKVWNCKSLELPDLGHFPQLRRLFLQGWGSFCGFRSAVYCHAIHVHLETLNISNSPIRELPDLRNFPSLQSVEINGCDSLPSLTISEPLSALSRLELRWCRNLRTVPNINLFRRLTEFVFRGCGVPLNEHEVQKLIASGFREHYLAGFWREPSSDVVVPPTSEADEQAAVDASNDLATVDARNDLAAGPSRLEPYTSEFIPYDESLSEFGKDSVPIPALELGSSSGSDEEQTSSIWSCCGCLFLAFNKMPFFLFIVLFFVYSEWFWS